MVEQLPIDRKDAMITQLPIDRKAGMIEQCPIDRRLDGMIEQPALMFLRPVGTY